SRRLFVMMSLLWVATTQIWTLPTGPFFIQWACSSWLATEQLESSSSKALALSPKSKAFAARLMMWPKQRTRRLSPLISNSSPKLSIAVSLFASICKQAYDRPREAIHLTTRRLGTHQSFSLHPERHSRVLRRGLQSLHITQQGGDPF